MSKSIALVLSSGGARGVAQIGVIEELENRGIKINAIAGSSMGALIGGLYAAGKLPIYKEWVCRMTRMDVFDLVDFTFSTQGFIRGDRVFKEMKKLIDDCNIEDLDIPFAAVASNLKNHQEIVFTKGSLYRALRASMAIPP
ncbi:MAG: patatin-like phospholipase family protein [Cyclobacteriaceae bacterium]